MKVCEVCFTSSFEPTESDERCGYCWQYEHLLALTAENKRLREELAWYQSQCTETMDTIDIVRAELNELASEDARGCLELLLEEYNPDLLKQARLGAAVEAMPNRHYLQKDDSGSGGDKWFLWQQDDDEIVGWGQTPSDALVIRKST